MNYNELILLSREETRRFVDYHINKYQIIILKANIPGNNKNINEAYILINYFRTFIEDYHPLLKEVFESYDGPKVYYLFNKDKSLKQEMIEIEENNPLGRFIDIDVYYDSVNSLNRSKLRKCYLCDKSAFVCGKEKNHSIIELINYIHTKIDNFIFPMVKNIINESIQTELNLHPKFGLVTPFSNGSHKDMTYDLMIKAKDAIICDLLLMFKMGCYTQNSTKQLFNEIRILGLETEKKMLLATSGINAYKGLIFDLGLVSAAIGYKISHFVNMSIFEIIKTMCSGITNELNCKIETFGKEAYLKYNITGARGEAENGFKNVERILKKYNVEEDLLGCLMELIVNTDDTVLLKRCKSIEMYQEVKERFKVKDNIDELNKWCITNNLSFGGSADLLVLVIFINKIKKYFKIEK